MSIILPQITPVPFLPIDHGPQTEPQPSTQPHRLALSQLPDNRGKGSISPEYGNCKGYQLHIEINLSHTFTSSIWQGTFPMASGKIDKIGKSLLRRHTGRDPLKSGGVKGQPITKPTVDPDRSKSYIYCMIYLRIPESWQVALFGLPTNPLRRRWQNSLCFAEKRRIERVSGP